jgi:hypothetical protein
MSWVKGHLGEWISVHVHAERHPFRLTVSLAVGELPGGWVKPRPARLGLAWLGAAGGLLRAPFVLLVGAALVRNATGLSAPYDWIAASPAAILAATLSLIVGVPLALAINAWPITQLGLRRKPDQVEGLVALEFAPVQLAVVAIALAAGLLFAGHLAADSYACLNGVRSAC